MRFETPKLHYEAGEWVDDQDQWFCCDDGLQKYYPQISDALDDEIDPIVIVFSTEPLEDAHEYKLGSSLLLKATIDLYKYNGVPLEGSIWWWVEVITKDGERWAL